MDDAEVTDTLLLEALSIKSGGNVEEWVSPKKYKN